MYKQSKLESQMRTEIFNQQSQQQNVGFQYSKLNQGLQSQALQNKGLISQGESQIQTATQNQMQNKAKKNWVKLMLNKKNSKNMK